MTTIPPHPHPPAQPEARRTGAVVDGVAAAVLTTLQIVGSALTWWVTVLGDGHRRLLRRTRGVRLPRLEGDLGAAWPSGW